MSKVHFNRAVSALIHGSQAGGQQTNPATKWKTLAGGRAISSVVVTFVSFGIAKPMIISIASSASITMKIHFSTIISAGIKD
jgi:hypothetical protein